jgi:hypothetical protein
MPLKFIRLDCRSQCGGDCNDKAYFYTHYSVS